MIHTLMICDDDASYSVNLAKYINSRSDFFFEARYQFNPDGVKEYLSHSDIDVLLTNCSYLEELKGCIDPDRIITLIGEDGNIDSKGVFKYQKCEEIMRQILKKVATIDDIGRLATRRMPMKMIGFYSPVKRCGQSTLALIMGQILSLRGRALYVNLEGYSSIRSLTDLEFERDMSDIMYELGNSSKDLTALFGVAVKQFGKLDILPPMIHCRDLRSINVEEWKDFFKRIENGTDYGYVLLDLSENVQNLIEICNLCERLYIATADDTVSREKISLFERELALSSSKELSGAVIKCQIPRVDNTDLKMLRGTDNKIAEYAKELIDMRHEV